MKSITACAVLFLVLFISPIYAQNENVFLDREFWSTQPTVKKVKTLLKEGHNPLESNAGNFDGIVYAILQNAPLETITYLLSQKGTDVNKLTHDGRTYIFWAANNGNIEVMTYLLDKGAKTDLTDDKGNSIINFAATSGQSNTKVYDLCLKHGADLQKDLTPEGANALLLAAPVDKDFKLIKYFTSKGIDINSVDNNGNGIFNYVAKSGNTETLDGLLKQGVKGTDEAFIFAAHGMRRHTNDLSIYKYLEGKGLNPNTTNKEGETPLHILASRSEDKAILNYLLSKGLDVNKADHKGNTPFINAASRNTLDVIMLLSEQLKDINTANRKGQTALTLAIDGNDTSVVKYLIKQKAQTDVMDTDGNNLAYYLINSYSDKNKDQFAEKMELLKANQLDLSKVQNNGNNWYHLAVEKNSIPLLETALTMNQDINAKNKEGNTALHIAALKATDASVLEFLVNNGAQKDIVTDFEESAYDLAKENELLKKRNISVEFLK